MANHRRSLSLWCLFVLTILPRLAFSVVVVTGITAGVDVTTRKRPFRYEINDLTQSGPAWSLFIQALQRVQDTPRDDPTSYYQIAGIHGYPVGVWDGVDGTGVPAGYCMHNSVLFPVWHRPYLALLEQVVWQHAQSIAIQYPTQLRDQYVAAAWSLRLPYWDWTIHNLPPVVSSPIIVIDLPDGTHTVRNPLYTYVFPLNMTTSRVFPDRFEIANLQNSVRHYSMKTRQDNEEATVQTLQASSAQRLNDVYHLLTSTTDWTTFSAYYIGLQQNPTVNIERIHNTIHSNVGGVDTTSGHMAITSMSAFDPIFWLHHANVDRLVAIWQVLNPDSYVEPTLAQWGTFTLSANTTVDGDTALTPFRANEMGDMWTPRTIRDTATFGYTYPEVVDWVVLPSDMKTTVQRSINALYSPSVSSRNYTSQSLRKRRLEVAQALSNVDSETALQLGCNNVNIEWTIRISLQASLASRTDAVYLFAGPPLTAHNDWSSARNLVGSFLRPLRGDPAANDYTSRQIDIECTHVLLAAQDKGLLTSLEDHRAVLTFLQRHLTWRLTTCASSHGTGNLVSGMDITVLSRDVAQRLTPYDFPVYGAYQVHTSLAM